MRDVQRMYNLNAHSLITRQDFFYRPFVLNSTARRKSKMLTPDIFKQKNGRAINTLPFFNLGFNLKISKSQIYSATGVNNSRCCPPLTRTVPLSSTSTTAVSPSLMRPERISSARLSSNKRIIARRKGLAP